MANISDILSYTKIALFILVILIIIIYSIPIIFIKRFHVRYNILTLNICLATMSCMLYWLIFVIFTQVNIKLLFRDSTCSFLLYMQMMCLCQGAYCIILISLNQLCDIVYHTNRFFKTKQWLVIGIAGQWIIGLIVSIPSYSRVQWFCAAPVWVSYYKGLMIILLPSLVCVIIHVLIFNYARSSTRRVQPQSQFSQTNTNRIPRPKINRRDAQLLRHMIFIFAIYVIGWGSISFLGIVSSYIQVHDLVNWSAVLLSEISALIVVVDLFFYNHELRNYLRRKLFPCY